MVILEEFPLYNMKYFNGKIGVELQNYLQKMIINYLKKIIKYFFYKKKLNNMKYKLNNLELKLINQEKKLMGIE